MATETVNITTTLADDSVTNAQLANAPEATFKLRRVGLGTGDPEDRGANSAMDILDLASDPPVRTSVLPTVVEEDPGPGVGLIESGAGVSPIVLKNIKNGAGTKVTNNTGSVQVDIDFTAADRYYYSDGSALPVEGTITSAGRDLLDDANAAAQRTTLGATTVGGNYFTLANPGAVTFPRQNADNTVTSRTAAELRTDLGLGTAAQVDTGTGAANVPTITDADARYTLKNAAALTSDFTTSSGTYVDLTGLTWTLDANSVYQIYVNLLYKTPSSSTGAGFAITTTGSPTVQSSARTLWFHATTAPAINHSLTNDGNPIPASVQTGNVLYPTNMVIIIHTGGSSSTVQLRAARGGTSNTITVKSGSGGYAIKMS